MNRCRKIECWIKDMAVNTELVIEMIARPWNQTLKDAKITRFPITSVAILHLSTEIADQLIVPHLPLPYMVKVSTFIQMIKSAQNGNLTF